MRPSKSEVQHEFKLIFDQKMQSWDEKNAPPKLPTLDDIRKDLHHKKFRLDRKCACKIGKRITFEYRAPDIDDVLSKDLIRVACVDAYLKAAKRHFVARLRFKESLLEVQREAVNDVLYAKANFNEALGKLRSVRSR